MPWEESLLHLPDYCLEEMEGYDPVTIRVRFTGKITCPKCEQATVRKKARYERRVRHENIGQRKVWLHIKLHKYYCRRCMIYFHPRLPGIQPYRRATENYRKQVVRDHEDGICQSRLAKREGIGSATVERWYHELLDVKQREKKNRLCPRVLGIDEHYFSRRHGFATTLCDLEKHKVFDVVRGRSLQALRGYLKRLQGRERVKVVCMDLSVTYRKIVRQYFPNAKIVADRFHVIRLVGHHFDRVWRQVDPVGSRHRGLLSLMRRRSDRLAAEQTAHLRDYLSRYPALQTLYEFKQQLWSLLNHKGLNQQQCQRLIPEFLDRLAALHSCAFEALQALGQTLDDWKDEVVRMWRFSRNNGITEGFHTKMELIQRRAYGFKNFRNYQLRVRSLCA